MLTVYVLTCDCSERHFEYDGFKFTCTNCGMEYTDNQAGHELVGEEEQE